MLITNRTWVSTGKSTGRHMYTSEPHKKRAKSHHSDISALVVKTEQNEIMVKQLNKKLSSRNKEAFVALQSNKKAPNKKSKNPYSWELYCGTNMKYDTRQSFLQWLYQPLVTRKSTVILNGLTCYQCKHYARFGSHSGLECNKHGAKKVKARTMIAVKKSTVYIDSS